MSRRSPAGCSLGADAATPPDRRAAVVRLIAALGVLVVAGVAVADQRFLPGETALLETVNGLPGWAAWPLPVLMQLGTLLVAVPVVALVVGISRQRRWSLAGAGLIAVALAHRLDNVLKDIVERPRPPGLVDGLEVREDVVGFAFPSGHTTMAFALAGSLVVAAPAGWRWLPWALAAGAGVARMYVGVHWPMDLVGGGALGIAIAAAATLLVSRYGRRSP